MTRRMFAARTLASVAVALIAVAGLVPQGQVLAQSAGEYFTLTYDKQLSKTNIQGTEAFSLTVTGRATVKSALPAQYTLVSEATISSRVIARHQVTGNVVTLNPQYTLTINPFPKDIGQSTDSIVVVPLQFPSGDAGTYDVTGEVIEARVHVLFAWLDATSYLPSSGAIGPVTYTPGSAGEGGAAGVSGGVSQVNTPGMNSSTTSGLLVDALGRAQSTCELKSADGKAGLQIAAGTRLTTPYGAVVSFVSAAAVTPSVPPPAQAAIVSAYEFGPDGASFEPPITLTIAYDRAAFPAGVAEDKLYLAYWDGAKWVVLTSTVDAGAGTVSARISHFTQFAVIGDVAPPPAPSPSPTAPSPGAPATAPAPAKAARFELAGLSVAPATAKAGETVVISATVSNTGNAPGKYTAVLRLDGVEQAAEEVTLEPGASKKVSFNVMRNVAKSYAVAINQLSGTLVVAPSPAAAPPVPTSTPAPAATNNWWLIGGAGAVVVVIVAVIWGLVARKARGY